MTTERYVVLRTTARDPGVLSGGVLGSAEALRDAEFTLESGQLTPREVSDAKRDPSVIVPPAAVMPVMLVPPVKTDSDAVAAVAALPTWGVDAVGASNSPFSGAGVTVAVLDTGIEINHEAFRGKPVERRNFTTGSEDDENGHGTHCAGTVFGGEVNGMRIGVAPGVAKALIGKVLDARGSGSTDQVIDGLVWAVRSGANVVSMSLGLDFPGLVRHLIEVQRLDIEPATSQALAAYRQNLRLFDAIALLVRAHSSMFQNAIVIAAAGNESKRPRYEIGTAPPAAADGFISVGALEKLPGAELRLGVARFSNALPIISAPGVGVGSARLGGGTATLNGTSMATPHVAGVAALWLEQIRQVNPTPSMQLLEGKLIASATLESLADRADVPNAGAGLVQAPRG